MTAMIRHDTFPRGALFGAAALIVFALGAAVLGRLGMVGHDADAAGVTATRELRFADRADGAILVYAAGSQAPLRVVTGQAGFMRGTLRALARERRIDGLGAGGPAFRLSAWGDGRLTLDDIATGERIELEAFGSDNARVFAGLLPAPGGGTP